MTEYRITKYNPINRVDEVYIADEWTSSSDIGKVFNGKTLSRDTYLKTEQAYIDCCIELIGLYFVILYSVIHFTNFTYLLECSPTI